MVSTLDKSADGPSWAPNALQANHTPWRSGDRRCKDRWGIARWLASVLGSYYGALPTF